MASAHALVEIDLNVRVRGDQTYAGLENVQGEISVGDLVWVHESESQVIGSAQVVEIDPARELVFLSVDWASLWVLSTPDAGSNAGNEPYGAHQAITVETKPQRQGGRQVKPCAATPRTNAYKPLIRREPESDRPSSNKVLAA